MADRTEQEGGKTRITLSRDLLWPVLIIVALAMVLVVNAIFIYIAVKGADSVAPSYTQGER